jgi:hypothetical protein
VDPVNITATDLSQLGRNANLDPRIRFKNNRILTFFRRYQWYLVLWIQIIFFFTASFEFVSAKLLITVPQTDHAIIISYKPSVFSSWPQFHTGGKLTGHAQNRNHAGHRL